MLLCCSTAPCGWRGAMGPTERPSLMVHIEDEGIANYVLLRGLVLPLPLPWLLSIEHSRVSRRENTVYRRCYPNAAFIVIGMRYRRKRNHPTTPFT